MTANVKLRFNKYGGGKVNAAGNETIYAMLEYM